MSPQINRKTSLHFTCFTCLFRFFFSRRSFSSRSFLITRMNTSYTRLVSASGCFDFSTISTCNSTMTDMSKLIPHTKHSFVASRSQVPDSSLRSEHFRFVAQTRRGQSVSFCIICTTSWAVFHLSMAIVRLVLTADAV